MHGIWGFSKKQGGPGRTGTTLYCENLDFYFTRIIFLVAT